MADGKVVIEVSLDDKGAVSGVQGLEKNLGGISGTAQKASSGLMTIVSALGLMKIAGKAIDLIKSSMDGAIKRVDTLNRFPLMMESMGFSAEETATSVDKLKEGIDGLPTTLDGVAATTQSIAILTGDLEGATDTTIALNNAFLASGSSSADAERGLTQYVQMLSKGEVDMQSWRTLQETMGVALNDTAKAFGFAGESAQNDLYAALQDGTITFDEFNSKIIELDSGVGGFAERAQIASKGIETSFKNIKTAVVNGLANMITTVDETMKANGFGSISENMDKVKLKVNASFAELNNVISAGLPVLMTFGADLKNVLDLAFTEGISSAESAANEMIRTFVFSLTNNVKPGVFKDFLRILLYLDAGALGIARESAFTLLNTLLDSFSEKVFTFVSVGTEIITSLITGITNAYPLALEVLYGLVNGLVMAIMENIPVILEAGTRIMTSLFDGIRESYPLAGEVMMGAIDQFFTTIMLNLPLILEKGVAFILGFIDGIKQTLPVIATTGMEIITTLITNLMNNLPAILAMGMTALWKLVDGIIAALPTVAAVALDVVKWLINTLISNLPKIIKMGIDLLVSLVSGIAQRLPEIVKIAAEIIVEFINFLISKIPDIISMGVDIILALIDGLRSMISDVGSAMRDIGETLMDKIREIDLFDIGSNIVKGLWNGIKSVKGWIMGKISGFVDEIVGGIKNFFGVKSPSRRLRDEVGKFLPQGIAVGIEADTNSAVDSMKKMTKKVMGVATGDINIPSISKATMGGFNPNSVLGGTRSLAMGSGTGSTHSSKSITNNHTPTIHIEKIINNTDADIPKILEQAAWIMGRDKGRLKYE